MIYLCGECVTWRRSNLPGECVTWSRSNLPGECVTWRVIYPESVIYLESDLPVERVPYLVSVFYRRRSP